MAWWSVTSFSDSLSVLIYEELFSFSIALLEEHIEHLDFFTYDSLLYREFVFKFLLAKQEQIVPFENLT